MLKSAASFFVVIRDACIFVGSLIAAHARRDDPDAVAVVSDR